MGIQWEAGFSNLISPTIMWIPFFSNGHAMDKYRHGERPFALVTGASAG